jgi:oxalate decarboxylase/phosphoglucose isomerase-like protein (cupin superfamily)
MRKSLATALTALALPVLAQGAAPAPAIVINGGQMAQIMAKAAADQAATPTPNQHESIISAPPYSLSLERRVAKAPAALHASGAELMIVLEGSGTLTTGGTIVNPVTNGANINGSDVTGGTPQQIGKGDFILVPENTAHMIVPNGGAPLQLATMLIPHSSAVGGRGGAPKLITHASEIPAMIEKAKAALPGAARFFAGDTLLSLAPIRIGLEYRSPKGIASVHKNDGEFMYVIAGEGHIPTGGIVVNPKDTGANIDGDAMEGATDHLMKAGDFIFVPKNLPHVAVTDGVFVLATLHVQ